MNLTAYFDYVRDIPYSLLPEAKNSRKISLEMESMRDPPDYSLQKRCLEDNTCLGKHKALDAFFGVEGFSTRFRICDFRWSDIESIPKKILALPHDDAVRHVYLEVRLNNQWVKVDATWDSGLAKVLPVSHWDGKSDTPIAVPCYRTYLPKDSKKMMLDEIYLKRDRRNNLTFYTALDKWFAKVRKG